MNVQPVDINVFAKFDEIPSLPVQDIKEKPKRRRRKDGHENNIPPTPSPHSHKHSLQGYKYQHSPWYNHNKRGS